MTVEYADRVSLITRATGRARDCLYFLAVHADARRIVRGVSIQMIADRLSVTWRRAKQLMQQLRELGEVVTVKRGGGKLTNTYRITLDGDAPKTT